MVPELPPWSFAPKGPYDDHLFESEVLKANPLHDPHRRPLWVYMPPGYDAEPHDAIEYPYRIAVKYLAERLTP